MSSKWDDEFYVRIYQLGMDGLSEGKIAKILRVDKKTWRRWKEQRPAIVTALRKCKAKNNQGAGNFSFKDYVFNRLPAALRKLWRKIDRLDHKFNGLERIEAMLSHRGKTVRQHLFLYALVAANFSVSEACRKVNIDRRVFEEWARTDADFLSLVDGIQQAKKDFFESHLVKLVKRGDTVATVFANRTLNKDRGYTERLELEVNGNINHNHHLTVSLDTLKLEFDIRKQIWAAIREQYGDPLDKDKTFEAKEIKRIA